MKLPITSLASGCGTRPWYQRTPVAIWTRVSTDQFEIAMSSIVTTLSIKVLATRPHGSSMQTTFVGTHYAIIILRDPSDHKQVIWQRRVLRRWHLSNNGVPWQRHHHQDPTRSNNPFLLRLIASLIVRRERNSSPNLPQTLPEACRVVRISFLHCCTQYQGK